MKLISKAIAIYARRMYRTVSIVNYFSTSDAVVESLARSAQAIANDHEERIRLLEETQRDLAQTSAGLARLLIALDED
ncbi:MAG: hypothetical protein ACRC8K_09985, partial [Waterburya sp.]